MLYIDFETRSFCDITQSGAWAYAQHPTTEVLCMAWAIDDGPVYLVKNNILPLQVTNYLESGGLVEAHNAMFERAIWESVCVKRYKWPEIAPQQWRCSAALCARWGLPRDLGTAAQALGLSQNKDLEGRKIMMLLSRPKKTKEGLAFVRDESKLNALYEYCKQDVKTERAIAKSLNSKENGEFKVWQLDQLINARGVPIDLQAVEAAIQLTQHYAAKMSEEAKSLTGGIEVSQRDKLLEWLNSKGVPMKGLTKQEVAQWIPKAKDKDARRVLEIRSSFKTSTAKYKKILSSLGPDNRVRDSFVYHGALTGRWAGQLAQFHNLPKGSSVDMDELVDLIKNKDICKISRLPMPPMDSFSTAVRGMIAAPKGNRLYVADFAAIEARVLSWLANCKLAVNQFRDGKDLYVSMAANIHNISQSDVTKEQRQLGKAAILGAGYGMGKEKFHATCLSWGIEVSQELASSAIATYRNTYSDIKNYWYSTEQAAVKATRYGKPVKNGMVTWFTHKGCLHCKLPSGRCLTYRDPKLEATETPWGAEAYKISYVGSKEKGYKWVRIETYGGKLVENITQAVARDILAESMMRLESQGFPVVMHVHDEIVCEVPDTETRGIDEFEAIMAWPPDWADDCPIAVEGWIGERYKK